MILSITDIIDVNRDIFNLLRTAFKSRALVYVTMYKRKVPGVL